MTISAIIKHQLFINIPRELKRWNERYISLRIMLLDLPWDYEDWYTRFQWEKSCISSVSKDSDEVDRTKGGRVDCGCIQECLLQHSAILRACKVYSNLMLGFLWSQRHTLTIGKVVDTWMLADIPYQIWSDSETSSCMVPNRTIADITRFCNCRASSTPHAKSQGLLEGTAELFCNIMQLQQWSVLIMWCPVSDHRCFPNRKDEPISAENALGKHYWTELLCH